MDCPGLGATEYSEFGEHMFAVAEATRTPVFVSFELTDRCNVSCAHCYVPPTRGSDELNTGEVLHILEELAEAGTLWLGLTGGEPLLRSDFPEIFQHAKNAGFLVTLLTNGTLITDDLADLFAKWPPFAVEITVHSMRAEVFDRVTGVAGSYEQCMHGIRALMDRGVCVRLKTTVLKLNKEDLEDVIQFARQIGVPHRFDAHIQPRLDSGRAPLAVRLSAEEVVALDRQDEERLDAWRDELNEFQSAAEPSRRLLLCGAGIGSANIDSLGRLSVCGMIKHESYSLRRGTFQEGWNEFIPRAVSREPTNNYQCGACDLLPLCTSCPAWAYHEEGDEEAPVQYLCRIGALRKAAIDEQPSNTDLNLAVPFDGARR